MIEIQLVSLVNTYNGCHICKNVASRFCILEEYKTLHNQFLGLFACELCAIRHRTEIADALRNKERSWRFIEVTRCIQPESLDDCLKVKRTSGILEDDWKFRIAKCVVLENDDFYFPLQKLANNGPLLKMVPASELLDLNPRLKLFDRIPFDSVLQTQYKNIWARRWNKLQDNH